VLIDVFGADPEFGERSREALRDCIGQGGLVACDVVWAELTAAFPDGAAAEAAMKRLGVTFSAREARPHSQPARHGRRIAVEEALATAGSWTS
jgi:hypothetical protein